MVVKILTTAEISNLECLFMPGLSHFEVEIWTTDALDPKTSGGAMKEKIRTAEIPGHQDGLLYKSGSKLFTDLIKSHYYFARYRVVHESGAKSAWWPSTGEEFEVGPTTLSATISNKIVNYFKRSGFLEADFDVSADWELDRIHWFLRDTNISPTISNNTSPDTVTPAYGIDSRLKIATNTDRKVYAVLVDVRGNLYPANAEYIGRGDTTAPDITTLTFGTITITKTFIEIPIASYSGKPNDFNHYEWSYATTSGNPSSDGEVYFSGTAEKLTLPFQKFEGEPNLYVFVRAVNVSGNSSSWKSTQIDLTTAEFLGKTEVKGLMEFY